MKFAKKLGEIMPKASLKMLLHRNMAASEPGRSLNVIHASDLTKEGYCPREVALQLLTKTKPPSRFIGTSLRYTFDMGRFLEEKLRNDWLTGVAVGWWECKMCGKESSFGFKPDKCGACGNIHTTYKEPRFTSTHCGASGGIDVLVRIPGRTKIQLVEVKSIAQDQFPLLKAPLAEHTHRTKLYLKLVAESGHGLASQIDLDEAIILYMCKGYGRKDLDVALMQFHDAPFSPFKEYVVKRDDAAVETICNLGAELFNWQKKEAGVPTRICPNNMCKRAGKCGQAKLCFSGTYPPGTYIHLEQG